MTDVQEDRKEAIQQAAIRVANLAVEREETNRMMEESRYQSRAYTALLTTFQETVNEHKEAVAAYRELVESDR